MRKTCKITELETSKICQLTVLVLRFLPHQPCTTLHSLCVILRRLRETKIAPHGQTIAHCPKTFDTLSALNDLPNQSITLQLFCPVK